MRVCETSYIHNKSISCKQRSRWFVVRLHSMQKTHGHVNILTITPYQTHWRTSSCDLWTERESSFSVLKHSRERPKAKNTFSFFSKTRVRAHSWSRMGRGTWGSCPVTTAERNHANNKQQKLVTPDMSLTTPSSPLTTARTPPKNCPF